MPEKIVKSCFPPELDDFIDLFEKLGEGMIDFFKHFLYILINISSVQ